MDLILDLTPEQLAAGCGESKPDGSHEPYCFELFRRAIINADQPCWVAIYTQYRKLVYRWSLQYSKGTDTIGKSTIEDIVMEAFTSFWRSYTADKLANANGLASILAYLKSCTATSVLLAFRKTGTEIKLVELMPQSPADNHERLYAHRRTPETEVVTQTIANELWASVDACCQSESERLVARLCFVSSLKPGDVLEMHPDLFESVEEVYNIRRNLRKRLKRSEEVRAHWIS